LHQPQLMMVGMSHGLFGLTIGFIVFLNIRFTEKSVKNKYRKSDEVLDDEVNAYSPALISQSELKEFGREIMDELQAMEHDNNLNEDRLNQILDKIIESGKNSLTPSELLFLNEYSKKIK
jgi:Family of unknown function (DUF6576)